MPVPRRVQRHEEGEGRLATRGRAAITLSVPMPPSSGPILRPVCMPGVRRFRHPALYLQHALPWPAGWLRFMPLFVACESRSISRPTCESISFSKALRNAIRP